MSFRCPYVDAKVWCDRRESADDETYACDSCAVLFPDMYGELEQAKKLRDLLDKAIGDMEKCQ